MAGLPTVGRVVKVLNSMVRLAVMTLGPGRLRLELVRLQHRL